MQLDLIKQIIFKMYNSLSKILHNDFAWSVGHLDSKNRNEVFFFYPKSSLYKKWILQDVDLSNQQQIMICCLFFVKHEIIFATYYIKFET